MIDNKKLYHVGSSLKDLGKKVFGINAIKERIFRENLMLKINNMKN